MSDYIIDNDEREKRGLPKLTFTKNGVYTKPSDMMKSPKFQELIERLSKVNLTKKKKKK